MEAPKNNSPIGQVFDRAGSAGRAAFMPYMTAGFPNIETCLEILIALAESGADLIEVGLPFSDPLADGPTIQASSRQALDLGVTPEGVFNLIARAKAVIDLPLVLMTYLNPVLRPGVAEFAARTRDSGASGVIIPDLPPEEADDWLAEADSAGLETIFMAAPTTPEARLKSIVSKTKGFLYYVSLTGVTGADLSVSQPLVDHVRLVRQLCPTPVAVGFGVNTPDQAKALSTVADGVIVGSAFIRAIQAQDDPRAQVAAVRELAVSLSSALGPPEKKGPAGQPARAAMPGAKEGA